MEHVTGHITVPIIKMIILGTVVFFFPIIATFAVAHSKLIDGKLTLFYCYILLFFRVYVENKWFEEKWVLMHLHFARDGHK